MVESNLRRKKSANFSELKIKNYRKICKKFLEILAENGGNNFQTKKLKKITDQKIQRKKWKNAKEIN